MGSLPHFFTHGAPLRALRARELRYNKKRCVEIEKKIIATGSYSWINLISDFCPGQHNYLLLVDGYVLASPAGTYSHAVLQ